MSTKLGTISAVEQGTVASWDKAKGWTTTRKFKGGIEAIRALCNTLQWQGYDIGFRDLQNGYAELDATYGGSPIGDAGTGPGMDVEQITNTWEMLPNVVQKDLLESNATAVLALSDDDIANIRRCVNNSLAPEDTPAWDDSTNADIVLNLMKAGVTSQQINQPILRHTWTVPPNASTSFSFTNVGKIISTAAMLTSEELPWDFILPVSNLPTGAVTRTDTVAMSYGWLKGMPTVQIINYGRREVQQEWHFGLWSTALYGSVI